MAEDVCQLGDVPAYCVEGAGEKVAQVVRKNLSGRHSGFLAEGFHFSPYIRAVNWSAAGGDKYASGGYSALFCVAKQLFPQFVRYEHRPGLALCGDGRLPLVKGFGGDDYPAVAGGISYLKSKGARIGVFSNKQDAQTKAICEKLFPAGTFEIVLGHSGEFPHKPSPEGALHIAEVLGGRPDETVVVGDSDVDMRLAKNGGFHPVGVSWGYRPKELLSELGAEMIIEDETGFEGLI